MKVVEFSLEQAITFSDELSLCIGYFDGLHRGHQALINQAIKHAKKSNLKSALVTFDPDPAMVVRNLEFKQHLYRMEDRIKIGEQLGLDYWIILNFTKEMSQLEPESFVQDILFKLNTRHVVCGHNFRFGYKGSGNADSLMKLGKEVFTVQNVDLVLNEGQNISSTRIIDELQNGDLDTVTQMLGRPFHTTGPVIGGNRQGQKIGFATANLYIDDEFVLPKQGVYIGVAQWQNNLYPVMINIGHNLTFNTRVHISVEGHILDFDQTIYGEVLSYHFLHYLREELKFNNVDELIERMKIDEVETRAYFKDKDIQSLIYMI